MRLVLKTLPRGGPFIAQFPLDYVDDEGYDRHFRLDFADVLHRIAIECNGGTWQGKSGHSGGVGIKKDYHRIRQLQRMGWIVLPFTSDEITDGTARRFLERLYAGEQYT